MTDDKSPRRVTRALFVIGHFDFGAGL